MTQLEQFARLLTTFRGQLTQFDELLARQGGVLERHGGVLDAHGRSLASAHDKLDQIIGLLTSLSGDEGQSGQ